MTQQGDVKLFQTNDDGDIIVEGGVTEMSGGLETAAYLSMFGGNETDTGADGSPLTWWANLAEIDPAYQYRSETQNLLTSIPSTTGNLRRIEDAASRDLEWMIEKKVASSIVVSVGIPGVNRVKISASIRAEGVESNFEFVENWKVAV